MGAAVFLGLVPGAGAEEVPAVPFAAAVFPAWVAALAGAAIWVPHYRAHLGPAAVPDALDTIFQQFQQYPWLSFVPAKPDR